MNRNFAILGLREDATKEQVKRAYERRLHKYKSSDYDDDPDYVRKKISELKSAYEAAYSAAGTDSAYDDDQGRFARRDDFDRQEEPAFERDRDRTARGEEGEHRLRKPDLSKLKNKMESIKETVSENMGSIAEDFRNGSDGSGRQSEDRRETESRRTENVRRLDGDRSGRIVEQAPQPVNTPRLDGSGTGKVIETPPGTGKPVYGSDSSMAKGGSVAGIVIALLIAAVMMFSSMCDDSSDIYYEDDYTDYSYVYNTEHDVNIHNTALAANDLLYEQEYEAGYISDGYSEEDIKKAADRFAKRYLDMETVEAVTQYLYDSYDEYSTDQSASYEEQITEILAFYGFMPVSEAEGWISPYTREPIGDLPDYLKYINKYYRENGIAYETEDDM